ncbi:hypothetical protein [Burkholderia pseudomallei]
MDDHRYDFHRQGLNEGVNRLSLLRGERMDELASQFLREIGAQEIDVLEAQAQQIGEAIEAGRGAPVP